MYILYYNYVLHFKIHPDLGVTNTELSARTTDDFTMSMTPVAVANYNTGDITVTGVTDMVIEGPGWEAFISCITPNAAVFNIAEPSCATVFIRGKHKYATLKVGNIFMYYLHNVCPNILLHCNSFLKYICEEFHKHSYVIIHCKTQCIIMFEMYY